MRRLQSRAAGLLWMASILVVATAVGQQPKVGAQKTAKPTILPAWLEKLSLSPQQKGQIETIVSEHDAQFASAWSQFGERYQEALRTEATVLATIEESLTETQRRQAHDQRRKLLLDPSADTATAAGDAQAAGLGVALTPEQEAMGRKVQEKFQARLSALGQEVQLLHNRLLSIEMDKIVEIEKILSKEQREQLSQHRQSAVAAALGDAGQKTPPKTK